MMNSAMVQDRKPASGGGPVFLKFKLVLLALTLSLHVCAVVQYILVEDSLGLPLSWRRQFMVLVGTSWCLNLLFFVFRNRLIQVVLLSVRGMIFILIGLPLGRNIGIELVLLSALLIETTALTSSVVGIIFSLFLLFSAVYFQRPIIAWNASLPRPSFPDVLTMAAVGVMVFVLLQCLRRLLERFKKEESRNRQLFSTVEQLTEANLGFQKYALSVGNTSVLEERNRFSREIHDTIGYTLTNIIIMIEACKDLMKRDQAALAQMLVKAGDLAQYGLGDTRRALHALRRLGTEDVRGLHAFKKLVDTFREATGVEIEMEFGNIPWSLGDDVQRTIYRFLQEGMVNAFKHGKASRISISFWLDARGLSISLRDNGTGSKEIKEGIGIAGMRERIEGLGGELSVQNTQLGFELRAILPFEENGKAYDQDHNRG